MSDNKILLVEDDDHLRKLFGDFLIAKGFNVVTAANGVEGCETWMKEKPDLVLLDAFLPKMDGFTLLQHIRQHPGVSDTSVIIITAVYKDKDHEKEARETLRALDYLVKPFPLHLLEKKVRGILSPDGPTDPSGQNVPEELSRFSTSSVESVPIKGSLSEYAVGRLLHTFYLEGRTGILSLSWQKLNKKVFFLNGYPVWVDSSLRSETLGQFLISNSKITQQQLDESIAHVKRTGRKLGESLIETGVLSPHELYESLKSHIEQKILNCFGWVEGEYEFEYLTEFPADVMVLKLEPARLILSGIQRYQHAASCDKKDAIREETRVIASDQPPYTAAQLCLDSAEKRVLDLALSGITVGEIQNTLKTKVSPLINALKCMDVIRLHSGGRGVQSIIPPGRGCGRPEWTSEGNLSAVLDEFIMEYMKIKEQNFFEILGVSRTDSREKILNSYKKLIRRFGPDGYFGLVFRAPGEPRERAQELYLKIHEAYKTLIDPIQRDEYALGLPGHGSGTARAPAVKKTENRQKRMSAEESYRQGLSYIKADDWIMAAKAFAYAAGQNADEAVYYAYMGWAKYMADQDRNSPKAIEDLEMALLLQPDLDTACYFLGCILRDRKNPEKAQTYFRQALRFNPHNRDAAKELRKLKVGEESKKTGQNSGILARLMGAVTTGGAQ